MKGFKIEELYTQPIVNRLIFEYMRIHIVLIWMFFGVSVVFGQKITRLPKPDKQGGLSIMEAFSLRASGTKFNSEDIKLDDMSELLWSANGINRKKEGKRTAPSAFNAQDIDVYVFNKEGVYLYLAKNHALELVVKKDCRDFFELSERQNIPATICLLVSDIARFKIGEVSDKTNWASIDAGMVAQNMLLFCASNKMIARPRVSMSLNKIKRTLKLKKSQYPILNIFISYKQ